MVRMALSELIQTVVMAERNDSSRSADWSIFRNGTCCVTTVLSNTSRRFGIRQQPHTFMLVV
jgi:hypothetical protein